MAMTYCLTYHMQEELRVPCCRYRALKGLPSAPNHSATAPLKQSLGPMLLSHQDKYLTLFQAYIFLQASVHSS